MYVILCIRNHITGRRRWTIHMTTTTTIRWTLGDRLMKARKTAGLEQSHLAKAIGVSRPLISQWENDRAEPRISQLSKWAELTNQPIEWLISGDELASGYIQTQLFPAELAA